MIEEKARSIFYHDLKNEQIATFVEHTSSTFISKIVILFILLKLQI